MAQNHPNPNPNPNPYPYPNLDPNPNQAAYHVAQNRALMSMARAVPGSREELLGCWGWGEAKVAAHGARLLAVLRPHAAALLDAKARRASAAAADADADADAAADEPSRAVRVPALRHACGRPGARSR